MPSTLDSFPWYSIAPLPILSTIFVGVTRRGHRETNWDVRVLVETITVRFSLDTFLRDPSGQSVGYLNVVTAACSSVAPCRHGQRPTRTSAFSLPALPATSGSSGVGRGRVAGGDGGRTDRLSGEVSSVVGRGRGREESVG